MAFTMKRINPAGTRRWALALCAALISGCGGGGLDTAPVPNDRFNVLGRTLNVAVAQGKIGGYSFVLVDRNKVQFQSSAGVDPAGRPYSPALVLPIASTSKALAAAAIQRLVDSGQIDLDVPIHEYLQDSGVNWPSDPQLDRKAQITLRMLLAHTSGLPSVLNTPDCVEDANFNGGLAGCVAIIASDAVPLAANPGEAFIYSGTGYQVAGLVAVVRSGANDWPSFFNAALASPLGVSSQLFYPASANPRIAGGAFASASAYATFLRMLLNGGVLDSSVVLTQNRVIELVSNQLRPPAASGAIDTFSGSRSFTPYGSAGSSYPVYGLGFFIEAAALHPGSPGPEVSDQGLFGATPWIDFGLDYAAMLLIFDNSNPNNLVPPSSIGIWNDLRELIIAELNP